MSKLQHFGTFLDTKIAGIFKNGFRVTVSFLVWELWPSKATHFRLFSTFTLLYKCLKTGVRNWVTFLTKLAHFCTWLDAKNAENLKKWLKNLCILLYLEAIVIQLLEKKIQQGYEAGRKRYFLNCFWSDCVIFCTLKDVKTVGHSKYGLRILN